MHKKSYTFHRNEWMSHKEKWTRDGYTFNNVVQIDDNSNFIRVFLERKVDPWEVSDNAR